MAGDYCTELHRLRSEDTEVRPVSQLTWNFEFNFGDCGCLFYSQGAVGYFVIVYHRLSATSFTINTTLLPHNNIPGSHIREPLETQFYICTQEKQPPLQNDVALT